MSTDRISKPACRAAVVGFLSDVERGRFAGAENGPMRTGDEYLDLTNLDKGVRTIGVSGRALAGLLPRKVVLDSTWSEILSYLEACRR